MAQNWTPSSLAAETDPAGAGLPGRRGACRDRGAQLTHSYPPLVFAGEARRLKKRACECRGRQGLPAAGRRLRRELRRARGRHDPRLLPRLPADGGGADLRRAAAGGQGRPHRRPVRQAALVERSRSRARSNCRATAATSSTTTSSRRSRGFRTRAGSSMAYRQSAATLNLIRAFATGGYANLDNAHRWMLGFVKDSPQSHRYQELARPHHRVARLHEARSASIAENASEPARRPISTPATRRCCSVTSRR
jgi:3-deoxy-7-phosphoheptulonate synthase